MLHLLVFCFVQSCAVVCRFCGGHGHTSLVLCCIHVYTYDLVVVVCAYVNHMQFVVSVFLLFFFFPLYFIAVWLRAYCMHDCRALDGYRAYCMHDCRALEVNMTILNSFQDTGGGLHLIIAA